MDVVAATFDEEPEATSAAQDLESELHLAAGLVVVQPCRSLRPERPTSVQCPVMPSC